ncbi:MAG: hypothetical protein U5P41_16055 [Gammaproteobacteria bacterium]|nr:hypothetical protein [Gammaproteobacteria bacterium]
MRRSSKAEEAGDEAELKALQAIVETERDKRLEAMKVEYEKLERARRDLRRRLEEITDYLRRAEVPDTDHEDMREEIGAANRLLINPPLLGAFRGPDDIVRELEKINRINRKLDEFEEIIRRHGGYEDT